MVIFKICTPFTACMSEINNTKLDNAKYLDVVMLAYNLENLTIISQKDQKFTRI